MAATNSASADEIVVTVEPDDDVVEDHLDCSAADLSGISGNRGSVLSVE